MPLSEEEKKERKRARAQAYYQRNKERIKARTSAYHQTHKEKHREANRRWAERHKEQKVEYDKQYYQTPGGIKSKRIRNWRTRGVICDNWDQLYETYLAHTHCMDCGCELTEDKVRTSTTKSLDHDHETGAVRGIVCHVCNVRRGP